MISAIAHMVSLRSQNDQNHLHIYFITYPNKNRKRWQIYRALASANCRHYIIRRMRTDDHVKVKGDSCSQQKNSQSHNL